MESGGSAVRPKHDRCKRKIECYESRLQTMKRIRLKHLEEVHTLQLQYIHTVQELKTKHAQQIGAIEESRILANKRKSECLNNSSESHMHTAKRTRLVALEHHREKHALRLQYIRMMEKLVMNHAQQIYAIEEGWIIDRSS